MTPGAWRTSFKKTRNKRGPRTEPKNFVHQQPQTGICMWGSCGPIGWCRDWHQSLGAFEAGDSGKHYQRLSLSWRKYGKLHCHLQVVGGWLILGWLWDRNYASCFPSIWETAKSVIQTIRKRNDLFYAAKWSKSLASYQRYHSRAARNCVVDVALWHLKSQSISKICKTRKGHYKLLNNYIKTRVLNFYIDIDSEWIESRE